jgi:hypothetical protein
MSIVSQDMTPHYRHGYDPTSSVQGLRPHSIATTNRTFATRRSLDTMSLKSDYSQATSMKAQRPTSSMLSHIPASDSESVMSQATSSASEDTMSPSMRAIRPQSAVFSDAAAQDTTSFMSYSRSEHDRAISTRAICPESIVEEDNMGLQGTSLSCISTNDSMYSGKYQPEDVTAASIRALRPKSFMSSVDEMTLETSQDMSLIHIDEDVALPTSHDTISPTNQMKRRSWSHAKEEQPNLAINIPSSKGTLQNEHVSLPLSAEATQVPPKPAEKYMKPRHMPLFTYAITIAQAATLVYSFIMNRDLMGKYFEDILADNIMIGPSPYVSHFNH